MKKTFITFNDKLKAELRKFVQWQACPKSVKAELQEAMQMIEVLTQAVENDDANAVMDSGFGMTVFFSRMSESAHYAYAYCEAIVAADMGLNRDDFTS